MLTTWPAFTEAMYLLGRAGGWQGQEALWQLLRRADLLISTPSPEAIERAARLMERYSDRPMDLADATLVALAEERGLTRIFTLDRDFHIYRIAARRRFEVVPGEARPRQVGRPPPVALRSVRTLGQGVLSRSGQ